MNLAGAEIELVSQEDRVFRLKEKNRQSKRLL